MPYPGHHSADHVSTNPFEKQRQEKEWQPLDRAKTALRLLVDYRDSEPSPLDASFRHQLKQAGEVLRFPDESVIGMNRLRYLFAMRHLLPPEECQEPEETCDEEIEILANRVVLDIGILTAGIALPEEDIQGIEQVLTQAVAVSETGLGFGKTGPVHHAIN